MKRQRNRLFAAVLLIGFLTTCTPLFAQKAPEPIDPVDTVVFDVKYDFDRVIGMLDAYMRGGAKVSNMSWDQDTKTIFVSARTGVVREIFNYIERYDVPPPPVKNIELTIYMVEAITFDEVVTTPTARRFPSGASVIPDEDPIHVPPVIEDVIMELSQLFVYTHYRSLESTVLRVRENTGGDVSGSFSPHQDNETGEAPSFSVRFKKARMAEDSDGFTIGIDEFSLDVSIPLKKFDEMVTTDAGRVQTFTQFQTHNASLRTNIDIRDGQKVVVGKTNIVGAEDVKNDGALFVVVTAKVVE